MICPACGTVLRVHDLRPYYTCPRCLARVLDPRYVPARSERQRDGETDTEPDLSLIKACAYDLSVLRARALARGVANSVTVCLHQTFLDLPDEVQDTMRRYREPMRVLGVPSEIVTTDVGLALCGAGRPEAVIGLLASFSLDIELGSLEDAIAARSPAEWFLAVAVQRRMDAVETVIAHVRYGGGRSRFVAWVRSG